MKKASINFDLLTIFPECLDSYFNSSILARAQKNNLIKISTHDIREQADNKHNRVDEPPYGGGPGMVLQIEPVYKTLKKVYPKKNNSTQVILLTPRGETLTQNKVKELSKYKRLILIAGHYEAIDARIDNFVDQKISLGNFILTGGELAAAVVVDSVSRLVPGVLGKAESLEEESFSQFDAKTKKFNIEYPQYTRPEEFKGLKVPEILLSGNHEKIRLWREKQAKKRS
ncbi:tRNA (guanosine(37)-N1)-methyltransferase TrmD [Patescibacteria group bacterium]|jgi:tRNA (guanine37-N1)-methyltransferase|nr:tRNA (guanosine(37)-N1)-methyltransferase TrmD [Patescibacteria group bacterium]